MTLWGFAALGALGPQQRLDRSALVHGAVALGYFLQRQLQVKDLSRVDLTIPYQVYQLGQEAAYRRRAAVQMHLRKEQLLAGQLHAVRDAYVAYMTTGPRGADRLHHRLLGADRLYGRVRAEPVSELFDLRNSLVTALGEDIGCTELAGKALALRVATSVPSASGMRASSDWVPTVCDTNSPLTQRD